MTTSQGKPVPELYHELAYYTLAHPDPAFIHQHIVDAYAAQTADQHTKPITLVFALVGLYLAVEQHCTGKTVQDAHRQLANKRRHWPALTLPAERGALTVADVVAAPPGRDAMILQWCASVWEAYSAGHRVIADLVQAELPDLLRSA